MLVGALAAFGDFHNFFIRGRRVSSAHLAIDRYAG